MIRRFSSAVLLGLLVACNRTPPADLVIFGRVWTGDQARPWAGAVAIRGDTIIAVGDSAELARYVGKDTRRLDNGAGLVTPGFMDGHVHLVEGGYSLGQLELRDALSPAEFIARIKAYAATVRPGEWITDGNWDHERWVGAPLPRRDWIDSVTPNNPVFISRLDGHMWLANSAALRLGNITRSTPDIPGGVIVRDAHGDPTGVLKDNAHNPIQAILPVSSAARDDAGLARAMDYAVSHGVTAVSAVSSFWGEFAALRRARAAGTLKIRVAMYDSLEDWRGVLDTLKAAGAGDDWLRLAGVKGYVDGSLGSTTAFFYEPYNDAPQTRGLMRFPEDSLRAWIGAADSAGLQVAMHAIGERANGLLLDIYDSVAQAHGARDRRFRIEHAQHLRRSDIDRIAATGVIASMQPLHLVDDGDWAEKRIGPERIKTTYAFRSLIDRSAHLGFGSDWSVAPMEPLLGIYAAVTRQTRNGQNPEGWVPEQKITVEEALRSYTYENAYAVFAEQHRGMLKPGYLADVTLIDQDLTRIAPAEIQHATIRATVVGGKVVYQRK
ncbi:MAG: amidohydrolase [Gemmatimonadota bacterium]